MNLLIPTRSTIYKVIVVISFIIAILVLKNYWFILALVANNSFAGLPPKVRLIISMIIGIFLILIIVFVLPLLVYMVFLIFVDLVIYKIILHKNKSLYSKLNKKI
ncbi:MAG: hypothetical protein ABIL18_03325 [candidate division WOR-3 bacterium]